MIVTNVNAPEFEKYALTHPRFAPAFEQIKKILAEGIEEGKHILDGDNLFINVTSYETKTPENSVFEAHKKYIDIQVVLEGEEIIGFDAPEALELTKPYSDEADCMFYALGNTYDPVKFGKGKLTVIFPEEPHAPGIAINNAPSKVKKAIFKVLA
jgi:YhcH/YjgK/YiaL family protein